MKKEKCKLKDIGYMLSKTCNTSPFLRPPPPPFVAKKCPPPLFRKIWEIPPPPPFTKGVSCYAPSWSKSCILLTAIPAPPTNLTHIFIGVSANMVCTSLMFILLCASQHFHYFSQILVGCI